MSIFKNHSDQEQQDPLAGYRPADDTPGKAIFMPDNRTPHGVKTRWPDLSDAEWAARQAALALEDGRYRLAASFSALADRADHIQQLEAAAPDVVAVPMAGHTRDEQPRATLTADDLQDKPDLIAAAIADQVRAAAGQAGPFEQGQGPTGNGDRDLAEAAKASLFDPASDDTAMMAAQSAPHDGRRCRAIVQRDGISDECMQGIRPVNASDRLVWVHIDPSLDDDHRAAPGVLYGRF